MAAWLTILISGASGAVVTLLGVAAGGAMELARRDFINASRRDVVDAKTSVDDVPVARPPLAEIRQMFGPASVHPAPEASGLNEQLDES